MAKKAKKKSKSSTKRKTATRPRKSAKRARKTATSARTAAKNAGRPVTRRTGRAAAAATAGPSDEDLDLRNRLKSGPRRPAGPPLTGDTIERSAMKALKDEVVPPKTEPKEP
jgi:hypothetical protein